MAVARYGRDMLPVVTPSFVDLRRTFFACFSFAAIAGCVCVFEIVLAARDGGAFTLCARLVAGFGMAGSLAVVLAAGVSPYLVRFQDLRTTPRSIANAIALGTLVAAPELVNKLGR